MTLLPSNEFGIRGHEGSAYDVNEMCATPRCTKRSAHAHHMWSRSWLRGQPYEYVQLPDGTIIGNRIGLCIGHHNQVTGEVGGYRARIAFANGVFWWVDLLRDDLREYANLLDPQPPGVAEQKKAPTEEEICPTCGHHKRKPEKDPLAPPRNSKTWTADVPADAEIGADLLDEWVVTFATILGFEDERSRLRRYHALVVVMAWALQHKEEFTADVLEASHA